MGAAKKKCRRTKRKKFHRTQSRRTFHVKAHKLIQHNARACKAQRRNEKPGCEAVAREIRKKPHDNGVARQENELHEPVPLAVGQVPVACYVHIVLTVGAQPEANIAADSLVIAENFAQNKAEDEDNDIPYYDKRKNARADRAVGRAEANFVFFRQNTHHSGTKRRPTANA